MARDVFILLDENSEDCATKRRMRHLAIAILVLAAIVPLVRSQNRDAVNSPSIAIFENRYKVVDRITFTDPIPFKAPPVVHGGVPLGQPSGFVGCYMERLRRCRSLRPARSSAFPGKTPRAFSRLL
jgi:hypothetical protein